MPGPVTSKPTERSVVLFKVIVLLFGLLPDTVFVIDVALPS